MEEGGNWTGKNGRALTNYREREKILTIPLNMPHL